MCLTAAVIIEAVNNGLAKLSITLVCICVPSLVHVCACVCMCVCVCVCVLVLVLVFIERHLKCLNKVCHMIGQEAVVSSFKFRGQGAASQIVEIRQEPYRKG